MASVILAILYSLQAAFSAYNLYLASIAIQKLQKYEEKSKTAAKYSNIAENQLYKTRTTQASGTLAVLCSFISSFFLVIYPLASSELSTLLKLGVAGLNVVALGGAWKHVGDFWNGKAKLPLPKVGDYNDAIGITQEMKLNMTYLIASWTVAGFLGLLL